MIDIHSHIIPAVDDGSRDLETSLQMIKNAAATGTDAIIATPHYFGGRFELTADEAEAETEKLRQEIKNREINIEIYSGQEIFIDNHTVELFKQGTIRGLSHTDYLLVEFPMDRYREGYLDTIYELRLLGARPIVAHPERYIFVNENITLINQFAREGCLFQINTGSITGIFGRQVRNTAERLIKEGQCHFIASDAHSTGRRCTGLRDAMEQVKTLEHSVSVDVQLNSQLLLKNEKITNTGCTINEKRSLFSFFKKN